MTYQAPVDDILFALKTAADVSELMATGVYDGLDEDTLRAVIEEAGKFGAEVLDPLNREGDRTGSTARERDRHDAARLEGRLPPQFASAGWSALPCPEHYGGQGLPETVSMAACEIWNSANMSFGLCPLLTQGAIDALDADGSEATQGTLPAAHDRRRMDRHHEPHRAAGGLGPSARSRRARVKQADGTYRIFGTKIFITYGDHDLTENIIHMVLARLPDAPPGTRGISLFLVPKRARRSGRLAGRTQRRRLRRARAQARHPREPDGGDEVRREGRCCRLSRRRGEPRPQHHVHHDECGAARGRHPGRRRSPSGRRSAPSPTPRSAARAGRLPRPAGEMAPHHRASRHSPDAAHHERADARGARDLPRTAREIDISRRAASKGEHRAAADRVALLTPVAKAFSTDIGCEVASMGVQVHGGMGFVEETGAAQYYRDARILPIYEGTNGIQAIDLVTRKLPLAGGAVVEKLPRRARGARCARSRTRTSRSSGAWASGSPPRWSRSARRRLDGRSARTRAQRRRWPARRPTSGCSGSRPAGHYLAKGALAAIRDGTPRAVSRVTLARFFAENLSVAGPGLASAITSGAPSVLGVAPELVSA